LAYFGHFFPKIGQNFNLLSGHTAPWVEHWAKNCFQPSRDSNQSFQSHLVKVPKVEKFEKSLKTGVNLIKLFGINLLTLFLKLYPGNTRGGSITVPLTSHLTGLD
jgi:hypothetical protein